MKPPSYLQTESLIEVVSLYISHGHNFFGNYGKPAGTHGIETVSEMECVAGRGIRGDRFFDYKQDYKGQITFFAWEVYEQISKELNIFDKQPCVFRRNVITRHVDLNGLIGKEFTIQGIQFYGTSECSPCEWMDQAFAPGAENFLKGNGGLRAKILSSGTLKCSA